VAAVSAANRATQDLMSAREDTRLYIKKGLKLGVGR